MRVHCPGQSSSFSLVQLGAKSIVLARESAAYLLRIARRKSIVGRIAVGCKQTKISRLCRLSRRDAVGV